MHREPERKVGVVIEIGAGRDDPVDESRLHQRDQAAHAEPGRRHGTGQGHADRDVGLEHALGEELAALPQPAGVIGQEGVVDQLGDRFLAGGRLGIDALAAQVLGRGAGHRFSRAWITSRVASAGSSVTLNNRRSLASIFPCAATVLAEPLAQPLPILLAEQNHRKILDLSGLNERERLEQLVESPIPAGEHDESRGILDEHGLANEEELEVEAAGQVRV